VAAKLAEVDSLAFTIAQAAHTEYAYQSFLSRRYASKEVIGQWSMVSSYC
jgi:hypothetical protein